MKRALQLETKQYSRYNFQGNTKLNFFVCILPFFHSNVLSFAALIPKNLIYLQEGFLLNQWIFLPVLHSKLLAKSYLPSYYLLGISFSLFVCCQSIICRDLLFSLLQHVLKTKESFRIAKMESRHCKHFFSATSKPYFPTNELSQLTFLGKKEESSQ